MSLQYFEEEKKYFLIKMSLYLFVSIFCAKMSSVYKPLAITGDFNKENGPVEMLSAKWPIT